MGMCLVEDGRSRSFQSQFSVSVAWVQIPIKKFQIPNSKKFKLWAVAVSVGRGLNSNKKNYSASLHQSLRSCQIPNSKKFKLWVVAVDGFPPSRE